MLGPENFQKLRESKGMEHDGLMLPEKIADTYFHIAQQQRSVWTHELDMRSFSDSPWWNDNNNSYNDNDHSKLSKETAIEIKLNKN